MSHPTPRADVLTTEEYDAEALRMDLAALKVTLPVILGSGSMTTTVSVHMLDRLYRAALATPAQPEPLDPRIVEAFDVLGAMWSWSEANGYFDTGSGAVLAAARLLREVVGRPAQPPAALLPTTTEPRE